MEKTLWFVIVGIVSGFLAERLMKGRGFGPHNGSIKYYARAAVVWFFGPFSKKRHSSSLITVLVAAATQLFIIKLF